MADSVKVYVTKHAMTDDFHIRYASPSYRINSPADVYQDPELKYHRGIISLNHIWETEEAAQAGVAMMRQKKIESLQRQINKLKALPKAVAREESYG